MHVLHVVRQFYPAIGGLEDAVANLTLALARDCGIRSSVVTLDRQFSRLDEKLPAFADYHGIPVRRIPFRGSTKYPLAPRVLQQLGDADIVHVHAIDSFFDGLSLTRFWHRRPLVASTHGGFFHTTFASRLKVAYFNSMTRASARGYDRIIASSENDAATFRRIAADKVITIENGVNIDKWKDGGSKVPTRTMIYIGRFSSNKNIQGLIDLVASLRKLNSNWRLIIAGAPADVSTDEIVQYAREANALDAVRVVPSPSDDAINRLVSQASYIASASSYEGFGLSIVEGLSAGLTPIVSDIPPFRKLVSKSGAGAIFKPLDIANEAAGIEALHINTLGEFTVRRNKNMMAASAYDWRATAREFANTYVSVMDQHRRANSIK